MSDLEKYRKYFTKDYLMGPNSFRLLDELIRRKPADADFCRTLDLGCGYALTSFFIANETNARHVYALDLWIPATDNYLRIRENQLEDKVIPIHGDAMDMPFAHDYFDAVVSVDAYHYFGCKEGVFSEKVLPFVKKGGYVMIAIPGLKEQPQGELKQLFETWAEGDDSQLFKSAAWWEALLKDECGDRCEVTVKEAECFDAAWQEWFDSGHEYGIRDQEFLSKGLNKILNFILIYVKKN
ncbi:MAG: methyltransferase domain-containing protein [Clostridia bacterium]|nr:methyltransferase domain-containing protein [Clostridia bacterium]